MADLTNNDGAIEANIPAKLMRMSIENKNLLSKAGSMYYGTGAVNTVYIKYIDSEGKAQQKSYNIPITKAVEPPAGGIKNGETYGIKFFISSDGTISRAILVPVTASNSQ
jgi:hypothetical protein